MSRPSSTPPAVLAMIGLAILTVACHRKPQPAPAPMPAAPAVQGPNADSLARARAREDSIRRAQALADSLARARADSIRMAADAAAQAERDAARLRETLLAVVHFDYDRSELRDDARELLDAKVPILQRNPSVTIRVAGHTDERGSDEYNIALGQRRASTVKDYLVTHGVATARIESISYGEERPVCQQQEETCFAQNRRAEFQITAGPARLQR